MRLAKEDNMFDDGLILTANSHGDNILCNSNHIGSFLNHGFFFTYLLKSSFGIHFEIFNLYHK